ncbi:hypothetical protein NECAME_02458 [Necator americanus]|uniref:Alpha-ketoglutarate-dependent dioxygenase AlkB-like domain-containing protein n=1 Tax=Necator americanus TaxID=51031 RepID=W2TFK7_NECAM|nr:hypothetical protein NECAME_02458 [Necator americanus]ETN79981.1 hypothetical protein NECAME_02458 [Necator americanus]
MTSTLVFLLDRVVRRYFLWSETFSCYLSNNKEDVIVINGLMVVPDFLTQSEEEDIMKMIDGVEWVFSQSGRRKQDYGPKVNFKHKKVKMDTFVGMPEYADMLLEKMKSVSQEKLGNYVPFEMCNLEYDEKRKSAIEMHFDDTWIWGNRLISINLLSGSAMTLANEKTRQVHCVPFAVNHYKKAICSADSSAENPFKVETAETLFECECESSWEQTERCSHKEGGELYEKYGKQLIALSNVRVPLRKYVQ